MSRPRGHTMLVPEDVWTWAQQESGLKNPGPWVRERLIELQHKAVEPALFEAATPVPVAAAGEERDWSHPGAPRTVGKFIRHARFPTSCVECKQRIVEGDPVYISATRAGRTEERCWPHGERYKNYWWPTVRGPWMEEA